MSSKRILVVMMAILVALTASLALAQEAKKSDAPAAASDKAPRLTIVEPVKDYGTVAKGEKLNWTFAIKNTGSSDLQIIAARPACGCTVAEFDKVVKPGETGKVSAAVDTTAFSAHEYDRYAIDLITEFREGLVLDCGAGQKPTYHSNVVNFEIVDYVHHPAIKAPVAV